MKRQNKATTLLVVFVASLLLAYMPLFVRIQSLPNTEMPLNSVYWSFFSGTSMDFHNSAGSSYGPVSTSPGGPIVFGDLENKSASGGTWDIYIRTLPILDKNLLSRTHAFVAVDGSAPFSKIPAFTVEKVGWADNFNTSTVSFHLDEGLGQIVKDSAGTIEGFLGQNSTSEPTDPQWGLGKFGVALYFDGNDDFARISDVPGLRFSKPMTIEALIKGDGVPDGDILCKGGSYIFSTANGTLWGAIFDSGTWTWHYVFGSIPLQGNVWCNVALTYDGSQITLFVNGEKDNSATYLGDVGQNPYDLYIGSSMGTTRFFKGTIDEVKISSKSPSGWSLRSYRDERLANVSFNEGIATFNGTLTDQRDWYSLTSYLPEKISSTDYPYLIVKFKSSAPVAYFGDWDGDVSVAYTFSRYAPDWQTVFLKMPSGRNISRVEIGIDDQWYPSTSGNQTVEFASIMLASLNEPDYSHLQVSLNNYTVFNDKLEWLTEREESNFLTINTTDHTLSFPQGRLRIEVPTSLLRDENYLSVSLGGYSTMNITKTSIDLFVDYDQPFWRGVDSRIWILGFGIEVIIGFYFIVRLTKWLKVK
jgi:hypothetical protein